MMFWIVAALVLATSLFMLMRSLSATASLGSVAAGDIEFYHSQQAEIARQLQAGVIDEAEARAAEVEAGRKLLSHARQIVAEPVVDAKRGRLAQLVIGLGVPALALPIYLALGQPQLPNQPIAERTDINRNEKDLLRLVDRLEAHLAEAPDDVKGFELAFPVYMRLGRFESAVGAAERLLQMKGPSPERHVQLAEAQIFAGQGIVGEEARKNIAAALATAPELPRAQFYNGLAIEQAGEPEKALALWRALAARLPDGAEKRAVAAQIARLGGKSGPEGEAADAIRSMAPAEQNQAVRGMVEGLEQRLKSGGGSLEEWQKLIRALAVIGEKDRASGALSLARERLGADAEATKVLSQIAAELSLSEEKKP